MAIIKEIKAAWKAASTEEKVGIVFDILCGAGAGILINDAEKALAPGHNRFERVMINITVAGGILAAAEAGSKALQENYGGAIAAVIDKVKEKVQENGKEEDAIHE